MNDSTVLPMRWNAVAAAMAALVAFIAAPAFASRAELEQLLAQINQRVLAGDAAGYMLHVDPSDPVFLQEQKMWAEDLKKNTPESFAFTINESPAEGESAAKEVKIGDGEAQAPIEMTWQMKGWSKPRTLRWTARFRKENGAWLYGGEKWNEHRSEGVVVFYDDGLDGSAKAVADLLPEVRKHVHTGFGFSEDSPIARRTQEVKLYGSMQHLQASIYLSYTDGIGGWNEPKESVKLLVGRRTESSGLKSLLAHEYGHVATFELGSGRMPWWVLEGVAELSAEEYSKSREGNDKTVRRWKKENQLPPFEEMTEFDDRAKKWYGQVYGQGHHMLGYISTRFGREKRIEWLKTQAEGASLDDATKKALGLSFADLDKQWRDSIGEVAE